METDIREPYLIRDEQGRVLGYRYRDHAADILGGYEEVFKLDRAGLRVVPLSHLLSKSDKIRSLWQTLDKIMSLLLKAGVPIPTDPQDRVGMPAARPIRASWSHALAHRPQRLRVNGSFRAARHRSKAATARLSRGLQTLRQGFERGRPS